MTHLATRAEICLTDPVNPEAPFATKEVTDLAYEKEIECFRYVSHNRIEFVPRERMYLIVELR